MEYNGILIVCNKVAIFIYKKKRGMNPLYYSNKIYNKKNRPFKVTDIKCWTLKIIIYKIIILYAICPTIHLTYLPLIEMQKVCRSLLQLSSLNIHHRLILHMRYLLGRHLCI